MREAAARQVREKSPALQQPFLFRVSKTFRFEPQERVWRKWLLFFKFPEQRLIHHIIGRFLIGPDGEV